ncbi:MAG: penicillin acylase family protein [Acidobacteriota bacterium]|nr:MAG: penicillin acylase family protein [Acidobacteriota bacterium]
MQLKRTVLLLTLAFACACSDKPSQLEREEILIPGLKQPVEVFRDPWGISHIYAGSEEDLFLAQGFVAARDRLFQLEMWRRRAAGTLSEILGEKALPQDVGARLLRFRGDLAEEMRHYHPRGESIITSFVRGINSYIELTEKNPGLLPLEFELLGIEPARWTPEIVVSRHNGLFRNVSSEVEFAQAAVALGVERLSELVNLNPKPQRFVAPEGLDLEGINPKVLSLYNASRAPIPFGSEDLASPRFRMEAQQQTDSPDSQLVDRGEQGSNNWVVSPERTVTGYPLLANDPHRTQQVPSLRYFVHLVAPGWNVIGGGEPALPGVSIGHNEFGAWGLTIFSIDQEDLYVYECSPDMSRYRYRDSWEDFRVLTETIPVKGGDRRQVDLRFTRHGPVLFEDPENHRAFALRAAWLEKGTAPYLASLRFDQARSWAEFQEACSYFLAPSENMVWADREGNIGWQATGITPIREGWNGLLPVPGDGRFEWKGFLPGLQLPHVFNPEEGFFATANQENLPPGYPFQVGFLWTDPFRFARLQEVLGSERLFSMADMIALQQDEVSLPARSLAPLLAGLQNPDPDLSKALQSLSSWDFRLDQDSSAAAIYMAWQRKLLDRVWHLMLPGDSGEFLNRRSVELALKWILSPGPEFGVNPTAGRDQILLETLREALEDLKERFGPDPADWRWGDSRLHHIELNHPLSTAVTESLRRRLDIEPMPRGGGGATVNMTGDGDRQTSGASFRVLVDLADFDRSLATNSPGQSGNPDSPHYRNLFQMWGEGQYFPLLYTREKVEAAAEHITSLKPAD